MNNDTLKWIGDTNGYLQLLDQRVLPNHVNHLSCETTKQLWDAIKSLAVRGAPAIGVSAAYGVCLGLKDLDASVSTAVLLDSVTHTCEYLASSRPTAVNLFWALDRMNEHAVSVAQTHPCCESFRKQMLSEARQIDQEDKEMCRAIGIHGEPLIPNAGCVLTHCNAGALATAGSGTALAPMYEAHRKGKHFTVHVDETRPLLQGARLTAWELSRAGINTVVNCDNMAGILMKEGKIQAVITGADRIAANGDAANKIGTYSLSILAKYHQIPFYIAAPSSTFDLTIASGDVIPIEQRTGTEITYFNDRQIVPDSVSVYNPAFDVVCAGDITAIITEKGVIHKPNKNKIEHHLKN